MELQHVNVKLYLKDSEGFDLEGLIPVFHNWIQDQVCEELLIDVADYAHVYAGPGIVLVGHEANYSVDNTENRLGLRYNRKAMLQGNNQDRFKQALQSVLTACQRLESDGRLNGQIQFNRREMQLLINDRLLAPNRVETYATVKPELESFFQKLFGRGRDEYSLEHNSGPRDLFSVTVTTSRPFEPDELLKNLRDEL